jgi:hypothetical protein
MSASILLGCRVWLSCAPPHCHAEACDPLDILNDCDLDNDPVSFDVNEIPVTKLSKINLCFILEGLNGHKWETRTTASL